MFRIRFTTFFVRALELPLTLMLRDWRSSEPALPTRSSAIAAKGRSGSGRLFTIISRRRYHAK